MRFDEQGNIWIRQSWFDSFLRCPERARLAIVEPEYSIGGDAAHCGNGAHTAIERRLEAAIAGSPAPNRMQIYTAVKDRIEGLIDTEGIRWAKYSTVHELIDNAVRCYEAWAAYIFPIMTERGLVCEGALCEYKFQVVLYALPDGHTVGIEGTIDYAPPMPELWDWKTAGRAYNPKEKQRFAVQGTIYGMAAVLGGIPNGVAYTWPLDFTYGIAVRGKRAASPQLLTITRTEAHAAFCLRRIRACVTLALEFGLEREWPADDDHFLCSSTWCDWWSLCKGAVDIDDSIPVQISLAA